MEHKAREIGVIAEFKKSATEQIRVAVYEYKSRGYIDLRSWFFVAGGELRPSGKGIRFSADLLPEVLKALQTAYRKLNVSAEPETR